MSGVRVDDAADATRRVDVWWLDVAGLEVAGRGTAELARARALLDEEERARHDRFVFARDRDLFAAAHGLLRDVLSRHAAVAPRDWRFVPGPGGKPRVDPRLGVAVSFNLTHTRGLAACAVAADPELAVGVDAEDLERTVGDDDVTRAYFAPAEVERYLATPPARRRETFLACWTLKEAYLKAVGTGLARPLRSFTVTLDPPAIAFDEEPAAGHAWSLHRHRPTPRHLLALAVRHPPDRVPEVRWHAASPAGRISRR